MPAEKGYLKIKVQCPECGLMVAGKIDIREAQPVWFDGLGWLTALLAVAIGVAVLIAQLGKW